MTEARELTPYEQGEVEAGRRWFLDLDLFDREEPDTVRLREAVTRGISPTQVVPQGYRDVHVPGGFFDPFRWTGTWWGLLEVATRYVEEQQNPDIWETVVIADLETGEVHPLTDNDQVERVFRLSDPSNFTTSISEVELILPIELDDAASEAVIDWVTEVTEEHLREVREFVEETLRALGVQVTYGRDS